MRRTILSENQYEPEVHDRGEHERQHQSVRAARSVADQQQQAAQQRRAAARSSVRLPCLLFYLYSRRPEPVQQDRPESAPRQVRSAARTCSCSACAPSPSRPSPSNVGTPSAAVKFPSDPPPVAAFAQLLAQFPGARRAPARRAARRAADRSSGGRRHRPVDLQRVPGTTGCEPANRALHAIGVRMRRNADVDQRAGLDRRSRSSGPRRDDA